MLGEAEKKFSLPESIVMVLICLFADIGEAFSYFFSLFPIFSPFSVILSLFINIFVFGIVYLWLIMKGGRSAWFLAGSLIELIPFLNILPVKTLTIIIAIILSNNPVLKKTASFTPSNDNKNKTEEKNQNEKIS